MKRIFISGSIFFFVVIATALAPLHSKEIGVQETLRLFSGRAQLFANSAVELQRTIASIQHNDPASILQARQQLAACRQRYKEIESFVEYFFENRIRIFNRAPVYEIEEPYMEYQSPVGLQVIEALLYKDDVAARRADLQAQAEVVATTAKGLNQFLYGRTISDEQILESLQLELVRIMALGITGYDAPLLKTGMAESQTALLSLQQNLQPYLRLAAGKPADSIAYYLQAGTQLLAQAKNFDAFDRLGFLTRAALPLQKQLSLLIRNLGLPGPARAALNFKAPHLFSPGALSPSFVAGREAYTSLPLVSLGEKLFADPLLSGNRKRSCAACHQPEKYFSDGLPKSAAFDDTHTVKRNTPSLLYAAYQHGFFLDARAATLEEQVVAVLRNADEMKIDEAAVTTNLAASSTYRPLFMQAFPGSGEDSLFSLQRVAYAIAAYERSLPVMTSAFDRFMQGDAAALSRRQVQGFNLFMGKAQCGTCHFAPLFNGLLPPLYRTTELESLGITESPDFKKPVADRDSGRYQVFPIEFYVGAFKTPTVRNTARTAPYMHNGALRTLEQVLDFYNRGGGAGMGLKNNQTLSDRPLHLSKAEMGSIIRFLEALTDAPAAAANTPLNVNRTSISTPFL